MHVDQKKTNGNYSHFVMLGGVGPVSGDCGFNPSRCTDEYSPQQVGHARTPLVSCRVISYRRKLGE